MKMGILAGSLYCAWCKSKVKSSGLQFERALCRRLRPLVNLFSSRSFPNCYRSSQSRSDSYFTDLCLVKLISCFNLLTELFNNCFFSCASVRIKSLFSQKIKLDLFWFLWVRQIMNHLQIYGSSFCLIFSSKSYQIFVLLTFAFILAHISKWVRIINGQDSLATSLYELLTKPLNNIFLLSLLLLFMLFTQLLLLLFNHINLIWKENIFHMLRAWLVCA